MDEERGWVCLWKNGQKLQMKALNHLYSARELDTAEFYPIPALGGAFGRTRPSCRNPIWSILELFR